MKVGERLVIQGAGGEVILEVTQIGKECPKPCSIYYQMGSCIMPEEGIFTRAIEPGNIKVGDKIITGE
jgi:TatD DNase family protein